MNTNNNLQHTTTISRKRSLRNNASGSNLSSILHKSTTEIKNIDGSRLSKSVSSDTDAVLHRHQADNTSIRYSGYLLKRSNQPCSPNELIIRASSSDFGALPLPDLLNHSSYSVQSSKAFSSQQQHQLENNRRWKSTGGGAGGSAFPAQSDHRGDKQTESTIRTSNSNNFDNAAFRLAASFFGYFPPEKSDVVSEKSQGFSSRQSSLETNCTAERKPTLRSTKSKPIAIIVGGSGGGSSTAGTRSNDSITRPKSSPQHDDEYNSLPPPDRHDPKDGHVWRAKYCVLENGVLYFYRNGKDGNSLEAQEERDRVYPFRDDTCVGGGDVTTASLYNSDRMIGSSFEVDHLAKSPMPRSYIRTGGIRTSHSLDSTHVIWEKRVALDRVGSVLASESDFGKRSFVLLGIDPDDKPSVEAGSSPIKQKIDLKTYRIDNGLEDRLILRADSPDDMRNWIFEIHRSLQILVNTIVRNRVSNTAVGKRSGRILHHFSSEGHYNTSHVGLRQNMSFSPVTPPTTSALLLAPTASMELSHGHGRSDLHRQQVVEQVLVPGRDSSVIAFAGGGDRNFNHGAAAPSYIAGSSSDISENDMKRANSVTALEPIEKVEVKPIERSRNKILPPIGYLSQALKKATTVTGDNRRGNPVLQPKKMVGKYIPPQMRGGKYVPPHRRKEMVDGGQDSIEPSSPAKPIFTDKSRDATKLHLESTSEDDGIPRIGEGQIASDSYSSPRHDDDADFLIGPNKRLGGCADPTLIQGSICDPMYIPKKASVVGKVNSLPYGSFGGSPRSGKGDRRNNAQWEVGAVSRCGIRSANEDAYLVLNDFLGESAILEDASSSFFKSSQSHGIFAIFDGHCGNHTARFAAEKFPSILLEESTKDDFLTEEGIRMNDDQKIQRLLESVLIRLDREFCNMCTANGRDWNSGATALVATVIGDTLAVAGLGDSNGVLCCALSPDSDTEESGWTILEDSQSNNGCNTNHEVNVVWKEVVKTHSPSREDEKKRIEDANGWITTETEISCSQIHRVNWDDYDVIDILDRSSGNGHAEVGRILTISRVCGDLAVSRALGDREFKAAYNILHTETVTEVRRDIEKSVVEWESDSVIMKDRRFKGDLISSMPEINLFDLGEGKIDEFLLLACDGLWDVMDTIDAVRITRNLLFDKGFSAKESADRLAELAYGLGSSDNLTVIVVHFHAEEKKE